MNLSSPFFGASKLVVIITSCIMSSPILSKPDTHSYQLIITRVKVAPVQREAYRSSLGKTMFVSCLGISVHCLNGSIWTSMILLKQFFLVLKRSIKAGKQLRCQHCHYCRHNFLIICPYDNSLPLPLCAFELTYFF